MKKLPSLSVFFPAYNEEKNIKNTVEKAVKILPEIAKQWEILVVNDGSKDQTEPIVKELIKKDSRIRMISHTPNRGYGAAIKTGLYNSRYDWICYTDSDGQFDFAEIDQFLAQQDKGDLIIGYRIKREDPFLRLLIGKLLRLWDILFFGLNVRDPDCGFKLIKKEVVDKIPKLVTESGITETEFLVRAQRAGFKIVEVGVHHYPRKAGAQTGANPAVILKAFKETFSLWWSLLFES